MLAKIFNDNAGFLDKRGVLGSFASKLAPTGATHPPKVCLRNEVVAKYV
ncbi:hypothetical protein MCHI_002864 [Candidatus Magnetoovum chiemensis]|nr:hypothetical protein MCHI_002864 [Candidatus Magnetoovum chiemensis]